MKARYCYWSVCDGPYSEMMEHCVRSARACGVFKEFHVLSDRAVPDCDCYEAYQCDKANGLFKLHYLKIGMSRLRFDYFVWIDADSIFLGNPIDVLGLLRKSPIHVPLEKNLSKISEDTIWNGVSSRQFCKLVHAHGVQNDAYSAQSAFWIVHHDAIDTVYELSLRFWLAAKESGLILHVSAALGYAMQMLCADPEAHVAQNRTDIWDTDDEGVFTPEVTWDQPQTWRESSSDRRGVVRPAILHIPRSKTFLRQAVTG